MRRTGALPLILIIVVSALAFGGVLVKGYSPQLGLDLQGGASVVYEAGNDVPDDSIDQAIEIIRSRVDALGVAEPEIVRQGDAIVVNLPGVRDQDRALEVIGRTAELRFRPVLFSFPAQDPTATTTTAPTVSTSSTDTTGSTDTTAPTGSTDTTATTVATPGDSSSTTEAGFAPGESASAPLQDPTSSTDTSAPPSSDTSAPTATTVVPVDTLPPLPGDENLPVPGDPCLQTTGSEGDLPEATVILPGLDEDDNGFPEFCYQLGPVPTDGAGKQLVGSVVADAQARIPQGQWVVQLDIRGGDLSLFNQVASQCFVQDQTVCPSGSLAIVLDGAVQSAPRIQAPEFESGDIQISGSFTERQAKDLALVLRFGALPVELVPQTVQTVSATLGEDSLRAGLLAGFIGIALVAIYMLLYYRALGVVVILGLGIWAALSFAVIAYLGETQGLALSLAGVTGLVVSVGVTVDSYVVFFERLKDEIRSGKTIRSSVDRGFKRAFRTILAANTASFIGAALLWWLTVGAVRGFAFFLGLSTLLDVVVAYFFARPLVAILGRSKFFTETRYVGVARGLGIDRRESPAPAPVGGGR